MAVAESCTGGMICSMLVEQAGASACFAEGYVTYSNEAKEKNLGVSHEVLEACGAGERADSPADGGGRSQAGGEADYGVATTGIAGPDGGTAEKPVGLVYIACAHAAGTQVERHKVFSGDRTWCAPRRPKELCPPGGIVWQRSRAYESDRGSRKRMPLETIRNGDPSHHGPDQGDALTCCSRRFISAGSWIFCRGKRTDGNRGFDRGAREAVFVEKTRPRPGYQEKPCLYPPGGDRSSLHAGCHGFSAASRRGRALDLIFLDPPYDSGAGGKAPALLADGPLLAEDALIVVEASRRRIFSYLMTWDMNRYGRRNINKSTCVYHKRTVI